MSEDLRRIEEKARQMTSRRWLHPNTETAAQQVADVGRDMVILATALDEHASDERIPAHLRVRMERVLKAVAGE